MSQFLILSGLLAFALWEERRATAFAALAGSLLGLSLLVRIDSVLLAVPLLAWLALRRAQNALTSREAYPLVIPFALLAGHALVHAAFWSRKYLLEIANRPYWSQPPAAWLLGTARRDRGDPRRAPPGPADPRAARRASGRRARGDRRRARACWRVYAYAVRPALSAWAGADGNDPARAMAESPALHALDFHKLAAHDAQSLVRLGLVRHAAGAGPRPPGAGDRAPRVAAALPLPAAHPAHLRPVLLLQDPRLRRLLLRDAAVRAGGAAAAAGSRRVRAHAARAAAGARGASSPPGWPRCSRSRSCATRCPRCATASGRARSASWTTWRGASAPRTS